MIKKFLVISTECLAAIVLFVDVLRREITDG